VDAPNWIQARKYVDACLKPVLAEQYTIHPPNSKGESAKSAKSSPGSPEISRVLDNATNRCIPKSSSELRGRAETIGIVRLDIADSQIETIVSQAHEAVQDENTGLFSPRILEDIVMLSRVANSPI
jgi:hypothetical protein